MKFLSDVDMLTNGQFGVEWEWADGGRYWQGFDTAEERDKAIDENQKYNDAHQDEVDAHFKAEDECLEKMRIEQEQYEKEWEESKAERVINKITKSIYGF